MLMFLWLIKKTFSRRKRKVDRSAAATVAMPAPAPASRPVRSEWERILTASLEQNCAAPSEEVIVHAFDVYCEALYGPILERRREMADLHAEISAEVEALQALAPNLVERAIARHPFEFDHIPQLKEKH